MPPSPTHAARLGLRRLAVLLVAALGLFATAAVPLAVPAGAQPDPLRIPFLTLPDATVGAPYSATIQATGGTPPYTFSLAPNFGILPPGLTLNPSTGVVSGTPTFAGAFGFIAHVDDSGGQSAENQFEILVKHGPPFAAGAVLSWGSNSVDQLGNGLTGIAPRDVTSLDATNPVALPPGVTAVQIAASSFNGYALTSAGTVYAWGEGASGNLGNGARNRSAVPVQVCAVGGCGNGFLTGIVAISAGNQFALALTSTGQVVSWGIDNQGQLGNGPFQFCCSGDGSPDPGLVILPAGVTAVTAISAKGDNAMAVTSAGNVVSWGSNEHGQIGDGTSGQFFGVDPPVFVCAVGGCANGRLSGITSVAVANEGTFSLAITAGGGVVAWGRNDAGQLGNGTSGDDVLTPTPTAIPAGTKVVAVAGGTFGALALGSTAKVLSWGYTLDGTGTLPGLGNGSTTGSATPVVLSSLPPITAVSASNFTGANLVLTATGVVLGWGNQLGQNLAGGNSSSLTPIPVVMPAGTVISAISAGNANLALVQPRVRCDRTVRGNSGPVVVAAGQSVCLDGANVAGSLTVSPGGPGQSGGAVSVRNSSISGAVTANGAADFELCSSRVMGSLSVTRSLGPVIIGDPGDDRCGGNSVSGPATLDHNSSGNEVIGNSLNRGLTLTNNSGIQTAPEIVGNRVIGNLACSANNPGALSTGSPNVVTGTRSGQCTFPGL